MKTTSVFIEHVIIGAEVIAWLFAIAANIDYRVLSLVKTALTMTSVSVILVGFCYVLGLIFDRLYDWMFDHILFYKPEGTAKRVFLIKEEIKSSKAIKERYDATYYEFALSRKRIIRGTAINLFLISASLFPLLYNHGYKDLSFAVLFGGIILGIVCLFVYIKLLYDFFRKISGHVNEKDEEKLNVIKKITYGQIVHAILKDRFCKCHREKPSLELSPDLRAEYDRPKAEQDG
ncbi:MAG: hypothetical protein FWC27_15400 [Firmicutes bacterium]|nr:hypothetical protein [Bacillota bacterium]